MLLRLASSSQEQQRQLPLLMGFHPSDLLRVRIQRTMDQQAQEQAQAQHQPEKETHTTSQ
jgi:hypothetical protein